MHSFRYVILEDELPAAQRLESLIASLAPHSQLIAQIPSVEEALEWFEQAPPAFDLLFADIELADGLSFEIFAHSAIQQPVIFTTAYDQYALQAFDQNSIAYLLKPVKLQKLEAALEKWNHNRLPPPVIDYAKLAAALKQEAHTYQERLLVRMGETLQALPLQEAAYFYTQDKVVFLRMPNGRDYPIDQSLEELEHMLNPHKFFRINRQFIVHHQAIAHMHSWSKSRIKLDLTPACSQETVVSSYRTAEFKHWLEKG